MLCRVADPPGQADLDLTRLRRLGAHLGEPPEAVAATLLHELELALAAIDAGVDTEDLEVIGRAAHAARNSALMVAARPTLAALRALEAAVRDGDPEGARRARDTLRDPWARLERRLAGAAGERP